MLNKHLVVTSMNTNPIIFYIQKYFLYLKFLIYNFMLYCIYFKLLYQWFKLVIYNFPVNLYCAILLYYMEFCLKVLYWKYVYF